MSGLITERTGLHEPVGAVEPHHVRQKPRRVEEHRAGLPVDLRPAHRHAELAPLEADAGHQPADPVAADDRPAPRRHPTAAVAEDDRVGREQLDQPIEVAVARRPEEPVGELVPLLARRLEPGLVLCHVPAGPGGELPAAVLAPADDRGDLAIAVVEHVVEQEDGPLRGREPLEQQQECHRQRVRLLGVPGRVGRALVGEQRLRQPLADVALPAHAGRPQLVDREPGCDRGQVRLRRVDPLDTLADGVLVAEKRLLHDVLGLGDAAQHPVGDREQERAQVRVGLRHLAGPGRAH